MFILETRDLSKHFGGLQVTQAVNLAIPKGQIHCLIGPNGAGKSTLFRLILGGHTPSGGQIFYQGEDITDLKPFQRVQRGISVKFQVPGIFSSLSVEQNLCIALQYHVSSSALEAEIDRLLVFLRLDKKRRDLAGNLSHGQKQWLEIGMAIALKPALLLLDEPTAGMSPDETHETGELVHELNRQGVSILAVEHDMSFVRQVAQQVTVLHVGRIFAQGTIDDIAANDRVAEIYLGHAHV